MSYESYMPAPSLWKLGDDASKLCSDGQVSKPVLKLIDNTAFIICGSKTLGQFEIPGTYPVDNHTITTLEILPTESAVIFDNDTKSLGVGEMLNPDKQYARAVIILVEYPATDNVGAKILEADKSVDIVLTNEAFEQYSDSIYKVYSKFSNPVSILPTDISNSLTIENNNATFAVKVRALVVYVKSTIGPNDPSCS